MDRLPPLLVRRLVLAPLALLLSLVLLAISPLLFVVAAVVDLLTPGSWRTTRLLLFLEVYLALEVIGLVGMFGLWVRSGFGRRLGTPRMHDLHFAFMRWWLRVLEDCTSRVFKLRVVIEDRPTPTPGPILVFSRHAGPGNSLLLIGTLLVGYRRRPRIVMLAKLQWEPLFDVMLNRLPNRFIKHDPARRHVYIETIGQLATGLGDMDAFVLFPEGKDFTPRLRVSAIERLRSKGHTEEADKAEKLNRVLAPRHGGVMAAITNAPDADVVFVAHALLEDVGSFKEVWSRVPLTRPVVSRYWRIPAAEVPREKEELIDWLFAWWATIDDWIADHSTPKVRS